IYSVPAYGRRVSDRAVAGTVVRPFKNLFYGAWRVLVWSEDAVVGKGFCGGEEVFLDQGSNPGRGGFYSSVVVGFSPGGGGSCSSAVVGFSFREGEAYLAPSSPSCYRRVEATIALHCRRGTRRKFGCEVVVSGFNPERRVGGSDESAVCPMTLSVEDHRRRRYGEMDLEAFRGGDGQVEAVCDACRSEGADASTCTAASFLDAFVLPTSFGLV
ncbi:hypothetical protein HID58_023653, partial [Brassica napus]